MPRKEIINVNLAAPKPNLSPATRFGDLVFVVGQTGRHPTTGEVGRAIRESAQSSWSDHASTCDRTYDIR